MSDLSPFSRFQDLLSDIFYFGTGDLDFGIYRIRNAKRKQVETFITTDLELVVDQAFSQYAAAKSVVVAVDLEAERAVRAVNDFADGVARRVTELYVVYFEGAIALADGDDRLTGLRATLTVGLVVGLLAR